MFKLVVAAGSIESVGTEVTHAQSCMPADSCVFVRVCSLVKGLGSLEVCVQSARLVAVVSIGTCIVSGNGVGPFSRSQSNACSTVEVSVASCLCMS